MCYVFLIRRSLCVTWIFPSNQCPQSLFPLYLSLAPCHSKPISSHSISFEIKFGDCRTRNRRWFNAFNDGWWRWYHTLWCAYHALRYGFGGLTWLGHVHRLEFRGIRWLFKTLGWAFMQLQFAFDRAMGQLLKARLHFSQFCFVLCVCFFLLHVDGGGLLWCWNHRKRHKRKLNVHICCWFYFVVEKIELRGGGGGDGGGCRKTGRGQRVGKFSVWQVFWLVSIFFRMCRCF